MRDIKFNLPSKYDATAHETVLKDIVQSVAEVHPVGGTMLHAGTKPPPGYLQCNGTAVGRKQYSGLFSAIGTAHGKGDGANTFNVPNLTSPANTIYIVKV